MSRKMHSWRATSRCPQSRPQTCSSWSKRDASERAASPELAAQGKSTCQARRSLFPAFGRLAPTAREGDCAPERREVAPGSRDRGRDAPFGRGEAGPYAEDPQRPAPSVPGGSGRVNWDSPPSASRSRRGRGECPLLVESAQACTSGCHSNRPPWSGRETNREEKTLLCPPWLCRLVRCVVGRPRRIRGSWFGGHCHFRFFTTFRLRAQPTGFASPTPIVPASDHWREAMLLQCVAEDLRRLRRSVIAKQLFGQQTFVFQCGLIPGEFSAGR